MRSLFSLLQNNVWVSLLVTPAILVLGPDTILWWWPGNPPRWAPIVSGGIGLLANLFCILVIGLVVRYFDGRNDTPFTESLSVAIENDAQPPARRTTFQTINLVSGIAAIITGLVALGFLFGIPAWDSWNSAANDTAKKPLTEVRPTHTVSKPDPTLVVTPLDAGSSTLSRDQLIKGVRSSGTTAGRNQTSLKATRILVNREDYVGAIEAALASASLRGQAAALTLVVHAAIEEGHYYHALTAHGKLYYSVDKDRLLFEIVCAIHEAYRNATDSFGNWSDVLIAQLPTLGQMQTAAESSGSVRGRDRALRKITETAILLGEYGIAINVASASYYSASGSDALTFVALCASEEYLFVHALDAAAKIPTVSIKAKVTDQVIRAIEVAETMPFSAILDPPSYRCRQ